MMDARFKSEYKLILATGPHPVSEFRIYEALERLGLERGAALMLHVSMRSIGWHVGGALAPVLALQTYLGQEGLLCMPSHSNDLSDPRLWENPPVPPEWVEEIMDAMPPYDPDISPCLRIGSTADQFRRLPGVVRSSHPHYSISAWGRDAEWLASRHLFDFSMGDDSPLARLYDKGAGILLYGVGFANCTMLHLAEYRSRWIGTIPREFLAPVGRKGGRTVWESYRDVDFDASDFDRLGEDFELENPLCCRRTPLGLGELILVDARALVDFGVDWINRHRETLAPET